MKKEPVLYIRYVDDALIMADTKTEEIEEISAKLSSVVPSLKFAVEHEVKGSIP